MVETMLSNILSIILSAPNLSRNAYLDPGSGSYLLQILLAALLGSMFFFRSFWAKILKFFRKGSKDTQETPEEQLAQTDTPKKDDIQPE
jgi:hypothetical protein